MLRYAEVPSTGTGLDEATAAPILTLANLPGESKVNAYCAVASAVDLLGNQSALPNAEKDGGTCVPAGVPDMDATMPGNQPTLGSYEALLAAAAATTPGEGAAENLANAGLRVGVDLTAPAVEFTATSAMDEATALGDRLDVACDGCRCRIGTRDRSHQCER